MDNSTSWEVKELLVAFGAPPGMESFKAFIQPVMDGAGLDDFMQPEVPGDSVLPWTTLPPRVTLELGPCKKSEPPLYVGIRAREEVAFRYSEHLQIFTDGSAGEEGVGSGFAIPALAVEGRRSLPRVSIFTAELVAIQEALQYIADGDLPNQPIVVLSDSMASLMAIMYRSGGRKDIVQNIFALVRNIEDRGGSVEFQWVPSHVGLTGNERADQVAKAAARGKDALPLDIPLSYADAKPLLTAAAWTSWREEFATQVRRDSPTADCSLPSRKGALLQGIPSPIARLVHRLGCNFWRTIFVHLHCICGDGFLSFHHCLFRCESLREHFSPLVSRLENLELPLEIGSLHKQTGQELELRLLAAELIFSSEVGSYL